MPAARIFTTISRFIDAALERAGYRLHRINRGQILPASLPDPEFYCRPEDYSRLYRPWLSRDYDRVFVPEVVRNTMLSRQKLYLLLKLLRQTRTLPGDILEAGVGSGGSAKLMLNFLVEIGSPKQMWLLDTFEGYQKIDPAKDGRHLKLNECRCETNEYVERLLANEVIHVNIIKGMIPDTLEQVKTNRISFAHIDVNLHEPTFAATDFCLARMAKGGVIVFDDYNWPATYGARQAIDEVCSGRREEVICVPESTQAFLIKQESSPKE